MNKRFAFIFIRYISLFVALSFLVICAGLIIFFTAFNSIFYSSVDKLEAGDLIYAVEETNGHYSFSDSFQEGLEENGYSAYLVNDDVDTLYPNINYNVKDTILDNLSNVIALPYKKGEHLIMIKEGENNTPEINNREDIDTSRLIDSLYTHNYNRYNYHIENGSLHFFESMTQQDYAYTNEFTDGDIRLFKLIGILFILIPLIVIALTIIMAIVLTRKLSRPLFFYADWLTQLSKGLLYKPSSLHNRRKAQKMYRELDDAVESLNTQLLSDRLYQNQIDYYRNRWLSQISHDLKSPLTSIYGYAKVMPHFPDDQKKYTLLISDKAKYMENLIDSLNSNFKLETAQMEIDKDMFSLTGALNEIVSTIGYDKINISADLDDEHYYGNKLYIERMFINLIENSLDHNKINPDIDIYLTDENNGICIHYKDNGKGMDHSSAENLMKNGVTSKNNSENHGIGFSVIKDAIEFHNGSFTVVPSESGVHFKIYLH